MQSALRSMNRWLLPAVLILFILEILMLPLVIEYTWSDRSDSPEHILTYTPNELTWDSATGILPDGTAELNLFSEKYDETVEAADGENVVAPGTKDSKYIRLENDVKGAVDYTAVLYKFETDEELPVEVILSGNGFKDTSDYKLPGNISDAQVLRAVEGTLKSGHLQDFDIDWKWEYEMSAEQDIADTMLGNREPADELTVGFYIVVEDNNSYITPSAPKTGDFSGFGLYIALMGISGVMLLLLIRDRRREKMCEEK